MRAGLVLLALVAGCYTPRYAVIHGKRVERPSFGYTDSTFFAVQHHRAYPGVLASDRPYHVNDGELSGNACSLDVQFFSDWYGNMMTLIGGGQTHQPWLISNGRGGFGVTLAVDDYGHGHVRIRGSTRSQSPFPIDIDVSAEKLVAQIGARHVEATAAGHYLVGRMVQHYSMASLDVPFVLYGREMLRTMVPADETVILLTMLTCNSTIEYDGHFERGFSLVAGAVRAGVAPPFGDEARVFPKMSTEDPHIR